MERLGSMMTNDLQSESCEQVTPHKATTPGWVKMSVVAAASGILGGLAAAWYYRKTLAQLRGAEADETAQTGSAPVDERDYDI